MTLLHDACLNGDLEAVEQILLDKIIDVNQLDQEGMTALHVACKLGHKNIVNALLSHDGIDPNKKTPTGLSALNIAYINRQTEIAAIVQDAIYKERILSTNEVPVGQTWLIDRMAGLGYKTDPKGMCAGIGRMARQAFLAGDYKTFSNRLVSLNIDFTPEKFAARLNSLEQEIEHLRQQTMLEVNIQKKQALLEKIRFSQQILVDTHAFFTGIALRHKPEKYAGQDDVFHGASVSQDSDQAAAWLSPVALDDNPIVNVRSFSGAYANTDEIKYYLDGLAAHLGNDTYSLSLDLPDHTVELSYSPQTKWLFTNTNHLPGVTFEDTGKLANAIHKAVVQDIRVSPTPHAFFRTTLFCTQNNEHLIHEHMRHLEADATWSNIHNRANFSDFIGLRFLMEKGILFTDLFNLCKDKFNVVMRYTESLLKLLDNHVSFSVLDELDSHDIDLLLTEVDTYIFFRRIASHSGDTVPEVKKLISFMKTVHFFHSDLTKIAPEKLSTLINNFEVINFLLNKGVPFSEIIAVKLDKMGIITSHFEVINFLLNKGVPFSEIIAVELDKMGIITSHFQSLFILLNQIGFSDIVKIDSIKLNILLSHSNNLCALLYRDKIELGKLVTLDAPHLQVVVTNKDSTEARTILESLQGDNRGLSKT